MANYQNYKPEAADQLNQSQADIQQNFEAIEDLITVDHEDFAGGAGNEGKHKKITLPEQGVDITAAPQTLANETAIYCRQTTDGPAVSALFFRPEGQPAGGGVEYDFTTADLSANPGWCRLPCGLIMKWGRSDNIATVGNGVANLANGAGIPNITTMFSTQLTIQGSGGNTEGNMYVEAFDDVGAHTITIRYWKAFSGSLTRYCYYLAIGI